MSGVNTSNGNGNGNGGGGNTSLLTIVKAQIVFLLSTLTEDNLIKNRDEIRSVSRLSILSYVSLRY